MYDQCLLINDALFLKLLVNEEGDTPKTLPVFKWIPIQNITFLDRCRNSQQGDSLIVDELGMSVINHPQPFILLSLYLTLKSAAVTIWAIVCSLLSVHH